MSDMFFPLGSFGCVALPFDGVHVDALRMGNAVRVMALKNLRRLIVDTGNFKGCEKPKDIVVIMRQTVWDSVREVFEMLGVDGVEDVNQRTMRFFRHMGMMAVLRNGDVRRAMIRCAAKMAA